MATCHATLKTTFYCKATFNALNNPGWPSYAAIQRADPNRKLGSSSIIHLTLFFT